jgi:hypothetical protein
MSWSGIVLVLLFLAVILGLGFRPRRPWVIHAHMNKMFMKIFFAAMLMCSSVVLSIKTALDLDLGRWIALTMSILGVLVGILLMVYFFYWSQPFSRKRTGVKAVDNAMERYKRPGEQVEGAWAPPMELDGKRYWNIYYTGQNKKQWLLIDEQGQVLRDEARAHTLRDMLRLVYQIGHPEYINNRTSAYMSSQKGITGLKMLLGQYEQLSLPVREHNGGKYADEIETVKRAAEVSQRFQEGMCKYWLYEAEWGNKRGGTKLKELRYADWQELIGVLHQNTLWLREEIETLEQGALAAKKVRQLTKKQPEIAKRSPSLQYLLDAVITQYEGLKDAFEDLRQGRVQGYERGLDDELEGWRSRLEWAHQVDGWIADGYTGKQSSEMKKKTSKER